MRLPRWIWPVNMVGAIAIANMTCIAACCLTHIHLFPEGVVRIDREPAWKVALGDALLYLAVALASPVGLFSAIFNPGINEPPISAVVFVPLNAYFWGTVGESIWKSYKEDARRVFRYAGCVVIVLMIALLTSAVFWLLRVVRAPDEWDLATLAAGTAIFTFLLYCLRRIIRAVRSYVCHHDR